MRIPTLAARPRPSRRWPVPAGLGIVLALAAIAGPALGAGDDGSDGDPATETRRDPTVFAAAVGPAPLTMPVVERSLPEVAAAVVESMPTVTVPPPPPPPAPEPEPAPASAPSGSVTDIIARHFGGQTDTAIRVARCESGLNPGAVSPGGGNHGLFQINNVHRGTFESVTGALWSAVYDAETNTIFAKWLYDQQGWGPWACA